MEQTPTPGFDRASFKARLLDQISAAAPKNPSEAKDFPENNRLGQAKQAMTAEVAQAGEAAQGGLRQQAQQPPDTAGLEPEPVGTLEVPQQGSAPGSVQAGDAAPKARPDDAVVTPFRQRNDSLDKQLGEANVSEEQLAASNEPTFTAALAAKNEATAKGEQAPQAYRQDETATITQAQAEAEGMTQGALGGMHEQRGGALEQVAAAQQQTMASDTGERAQISVQIEAIYERTKQRLNERLAQMDEQVNRAFDAGAESARAAFESYVEGRLDERYSGVTGWGRWLDDKVFSVGLAEPVARIFEEGRAQYLAQMDGVIDQVVDVVERGITDARAIVAEGRQEIATYVASLPVALQDVGRQAASDIQSRFDELDAGIDAKQNELVDSLARRYAEQVQALDARVEELQAEHSSFASRAWSAVKGVVEAILRLKDMLLSVLARAADAIEGIIRDPIGFLGNLIDGVKAGLDNFLSKIWDHLSRALQEWLFGALTGAGITLPDNLDEAGILDLVMQILGMTYQNIRARAVRIVGEGVVARLEQFAEPFIVLMRDGPGGLWEWIKEKLTNLKDMVLGEIQEWAITKVIKAGIMWIISLLNPAAAFIKACKAIYDIVMFFIERGSQIMEMVNAVVESISAIAKGAIGGVATKVEGALARTLPVVISFLASLLGLGGISAKIRGVIEKLQAPIGNAIEWIVEKSVSLVRAAGNLLGLGSDEPGDDAVEEMDSTIPGPVDAADHAGVARYAVAELESVEDDGTADDVRARLQQRAEALEEHWTEMLEVGIALSVDAEQSAVDNPDIRFEVRVAPNTTMARGKIDLSTDSAGPTSSWTESLSSEVHEEFASAESVAPQPGWDETAAEEAVTLARLEAILEVEEVRDLVKRVRDHGQPRRRSQTIALSGNEISTVAAAGGQKMSSGQAAEIIHLDMEPQHTAESHSHAEFTLFMQATDVERWIFASNYFCGLCEIMIRRAGGEILPDKAASRAYSHRSRLARFPESSEPADRVTAANVREVIGLDDVIELAEAWGKSLREDKELQKLLAFLKIDLGPVDLNSASSSDFQTLPGIGSALARRIIDFRNAHGPFGGVDDLTQIRGIGDVTVATLRPHVTT